MLCYLSTKALRTLRNTKEMITQKYINDIAYKIVGWAIEVHKNLGYYSTFIVKIS